MNPSHDRRIHADALRRHDRANRAARLKRQAGVILSIIALGAVAVPKMLLDEDMLEAATTYYKAKAIAWFAQGTVANPTIRMKMAGVEYVVSTAAITERPYYRVSANAVVSKAIGGGIVGLGAWVFSLWLFRNALARQRERALQDRVVAGTQVTSEAKLAKILRVESGADALAVGTVPIPERLETRHMAMVGTTGSGKTTALRQLMDGIEARGEAALIYDTSGEFVAHYYRPERGDVILNPFDDRCAFWTPFAEISHPADAARIAHHLVPETGHQDNDVWLQTSRILVANMIRKLWQEGNCSLPALLDALQVRGKDELKTWLASTSSARTFADDADRASGSVLFMLAMASDLIQFLQVDDNGGVPFAFRDFIHGLDKISGPRPWIFVPRKEDYFQACKPLLACWLECAASAVLGLPPSPDRRIWFILDELADLPRVDNLARLLPEGRKFGAAVVLTFQALGQMRHRYGPQIAESMLGCCNTKLFLQTIDSETRQWARPGNGPAKPSVNAKLKFAP